MTIDRIVPPRGDQSGAEGFLAGRTALVTGAARRVGRSLALALARQSAAVVIHYRRSSSAAEETAAEIRQAGGVAHLVAGDLADAAVAETLVQRAAEVAGNPVDLLVNNASIFEQGTIVDTTSAQWNQNQAVNLRAPFLLAQALARQLPADRPGDIVNLNDYRAVRPGPDHLAYTVAKTGLHGLTGALAVALAPAIRVNELALGAVLPPEKAPDEYMHTLRQEIPTGRFPRLQEVEHALLFLLGNAAVTGQTIFLDGGRHLV